MSISTWSPFYLRSICLRVALVQGDVGGFHLQTLKDKSRKINVDKSSSLLDLLIHQSSVNWHSFQIGVTGGIYPSGHHATDENTPRTAENTPSDLGAPPLYDGLLQCFKRVAQWQQRVRFNFRSLKCLSIFCFAMLVRRASWIEETAQQRRLCLSRKNCDLLLPFLSGSSCCHLERPRNPLRTPRWIFIIFVLALQTTEYLKVTWKIGEQNEAPSIITAAIHARSQPCGGRVV